METEKETEFSQNKVPNTDSHPEGAQSEHLLKRIKEDILRRRKRALIVKRIILFYQAPLMTYVLLSYLTDWLFHFRFPWAEDIRGVAQFASMGGLLMYWGLRDDNADRLASVATVKDVGALVDIYAPAQYGYDGDTRKAVKASLTQLLPQLRASDADLLNKEQRKVLYDALNREKDRAFQLAILKWLEQVSDAEAVKAVEKMTLPGSKCRKDKELQAAAQALLPHLREVARMEQERRTLVRAADSPGQPAALLLRPASDVGTADADKLLRPMLYSEPE